MTIIARSVQEIAIEDGWRAEHGLDPLGARGTASGLMWLVEVCELTTYPPYMRQYPYRVEGRIIDCGIDRGPFGWHIGSLADAAYVLAGGVSIPEV